MARRSGGDPRKLLATVFVIAAGTTAVLSLDATVVLLTPVVLATARTLGSPARPHAFATAHLSNTASLLLPVSNLTNLLAFSAAGVSFAHFTALMALPVAVGDRGRICLAAVCFRRRTHRRDQPGPTPPPAEAARYSCSRCWARRWRASRSRRARRWLPRGPRWRGCSCSVSAAWRAAAPPWSGLIARPRDVPFLAFVLGLGVVVTGGHAHGLGDRDGPPCSGRHGPARAAGHRRRRRAVGQHRQQPARGAWCCFRW